MYSNIYFNVFFHQDFTDWRPSSFEHKKKLKKGNEEKGKQERSLGAAGEGAISPVEGGRRHTPATFPRTKTASMPRAQKMALENLRTQLTFSDTEEVDILQMKRNDNDIEV